MTRIPASALLLGIAGLIPFLWGAMLTAGIAPAAPGSLPFGLSTDGTLLMVRYGGIILPFMSGVLWGFATRANGSRAFAAYGLSVVPAIWWFLFPGTNAPSALINLMTGFAGLLILDYAYQRWGLAPAWWLSLRIPLTLTVLACFATGLLI